MNLQINLNMHDVARLNVTIRKLCKTSKKTFSKEGRAPSVQPATQKKTSILETKTFLPVMILRDPTATWNEKILNRKDAPANTAQASRPLFEHGMTVPLRTLKVNSSGADSKVCDEASISQNKVKDHEDFSATNQDQTAASKASSWGSMVSASDFPKKTQSLNLPKRDNRRKEDASGVVKAYKERLLKAMREPSLDPSFVFTAMGPVRFVAEEAAAAWADFEAQRRAEAQASTSSQWVRAYGGCLPCAKSLQAAAQHADFLNELAEALNSKKSKPVHLCHSLREMKRLCQTPSVCFSKDAARAPCPFEEKVSRSLHALQHKTFHVDVPQAEVFRKKESALTFFDILQLKSLYAPRADTVPAELKTFLSYVAKGERALLSTRGTYLTRNEEGGYVMPDPLRERIAEKLQTLCPLRLLARVQTVRNDATEFLLHDQTQPVVQWMQRGAFEAPRTVDLKFRPIPLNALYVRALASQKHLDDLSEGMEDWLVGHITQALARFENRAFLRGTGDQQPLGILSCVEGFAEKGEAGIQDVSSEESHTSNKKTSPNAGKASETSRESRSQNEAQGGSNASEDSVLPSQTDNLPWVFPDSGLPRFQGLVEERPIEAITSNAITAEILLQMVSALGTEYLPNASWLLSRSALAALQRLQDNTGHFLWQPSMALGAPSSLFGYPVFVSDDMSTCGAEGGVPVLFGDFREGYTIVERGALSLLRDPYSAKPYVEFYTTRSVGGSVVNPEALKALRIEA